MCVCAYVMPGHERPHGIVFNQENRRAIYMGAQLRHNPACQHDVAHSLRADTPNSDACRDLGHAVLKNQTGVVTPFLKWTKMCQYFHSNGKDCTDVHRHTVENRKGLV